MATLTLDEIGRILEPYGLDAPESLRASLSDYLELLLKWNARTNLTSIRLPEEIVRRHFGESLFAARHVGRAGTLLDYGSGAGFPGMPIALARADIQVTLGESQNKKAAFLREAVRVLGVSAEVWPRRVEEMAADRRFDCVALRAVDSMGSAIAGAASRSVREVLILSSGGPAAEIVVPDGFEVGERIAIPCSRDGVIVRMCRV
jgi:16S rRNA (guanine527-N7)-methyltransferase